MVGMPIERAVRSIRLTTARMKNRPKMRQRMLVAGTAPMAETAGPVAVCSMGSLLVAPIP
jgi:hypothetical protein